MIRVCHTYNRSLSTRTTALSICSTCTPAQSQSHSLSHTVSVTQSPSHSLRHTVSSSSLSLAPRASPFSLDMATCVFAWPLVLRGCVYCLAACIAWPLVLRGSLYCLAACIAWPLPRLPSDLSLSLHDVFFLFFCCVLPTWRA